MKIRIVALGLVIGLTGCGSDSSDEQRKIRETVTEHETALALFEAETVCRLMTEERIERSKRALGGSETCEEWVRKLEGVSDNAESQEPLHVGNVVRKGSAINAELVRNPSDVQINIAGDRAEATFSGSIEARNNMSQIEDMENTYHLRRVDGQWLMDKEPASETASSGGDGAGGRAPTGQGSACPEETSAENGPWGSNLQVWGGDCDEAYSIARTALNGDDGQVDIPGFECEIGEPSYEGANYTCWNGTVTLRGRFGY